MKKILLALSLIFSSLTLAQIFEVEKDILERNDKEKLTVVSKTLKNLKSNTHFDGVFFKIVQGTSDEPIKMDDSILARKAANVYYHLEKGREFFTKLGQEQLKKSVVIRLEIQNKFNKTFHFNNPRVDPVFNNATTTDGGTGEPDFGIDSWDNEIWFRPAKKIALSKEAKKKFKQTIRGAIPKNTSVNNDVLIFTAAEALLAEDTEAALQSSAEDILSNYVRDAAIRWLVPEISTLLILQKYYYDAAFIPEIIYHEYAHLMMSDYLPPVVNNTLLEGIADYFSSKIADSPFLAHKLGNYGAMLQKRDATSETYYEDKLDGPQGLGTDFVLSLLYELDEEVNKLSKGEDPLYFSRKLFDMRKSLSLDSTIGFDLGELIIDYFPKYHRNLTAIMSQRGI